MSYAVAVDRVSSLYFLIDFPRRIIKSAIRNTRHFNLFVSA